MISNPEGSAGRLPGHHPAKTELCTEPTSNDNCSDYIFVSPNLAASTATGVIDVDVSDHRPVLARTGLAGQLRE